MVLILHYLSHIYKESVILVFVNGARNGARTRDNRNHNPGLYQLSYSRH